MTSFAANYSDSGSRVQDALKRAWGHPGTRQALLLAGLVAFGAFWGAAIAVAGLAALLLCVAIVCCIFVMRDFRVGVVMLMLIVPIAGSYAFPHSMFGVTGMNPLNLLLAATLGMYVMRAAGSGSVRHFMPRSMVVLYLIPLTAAALLGMNEAKNIPPDFMALDMIFFNEPVGYIRDMLMKPLTIVIYSMLLAAAVWRSKRPERFVIPMIISSWIMGLLVIGFVLEAGVGLSDLAGTFARHFLSAIGMHANDLGRLYVVAYALLLFVWDKSDNWPLKTVVFFTMVLVTASLVITFSRGAYMGFVIVNVIYLLSRRNWKTVTLAVVAIPIFIYFLPGAVWSRLEAGQGEGANAVSAGRIDMIWTPLMPEMMDSPIIGNGLGAIMFSKAMRTGQLDTYAHPHNAYLQAYLDLGIVGVVVFVSFWIYLWYRFRQYAKDERVHPHLQGLFEGAAAGIVSFLIAGFAGSSLEPVPEQAFLWLAIGVLYGMKLRLKYGMKYGVKGI
jgi:O-antigen ligase